MRPVNKAKDATLYLYDEISFWGIDSQEFVKEINSLDADTIHLRIDSPGGDVFGARAIATALKQHPATIIAHVDGLAASAATVIVMAADEIEIVDGGFMMIHSALSFFDILGYFNAAYLDTLMEDMRKERDLLAKVDGSIANDYAKRTGKEADEVLAAMKAVTWFTAQEAVDYGLANRIYDGTPKENRFDLSGFSNVPENLKRAEDAAPSKRKLEKALRDVGLSQSQAKAILADGLKDEVQRDVSPSPTEPSPEPQREVAATVAPVAEAIPEVEAPTDKTKALYMRFATIRSTAK